MTGRATVLCAVLLGALILAPEAWARRVATMPATIRLKAYLAAPDAARLERLGPDLARMRAEAEAGNEARALLRGAFQARWLDGTSGSLTLGQFDQLTAGVSGVFGAGDGELVDLLAAALPAAWSDRAFLEWVRRKWPAGAAGEAATERVVSAAAAVALVTDAVPRLAFALEVGPAAASTRVRAALDALVDGCAVEAMGALHGRLTELDAMESLGRWKRERLSSNASRRLGDRLFAAAVRGWAAAGTALTALVGASSHGPAEWVQRAAEAVRAGETSETIAGVLATLCGLMPAPAAHAALAPATEVGSFIWYHTAGVLRPLHGRDAGLRARDYDAVKRFVTQGHGRALFAVTRDVYYADANLAEAVFADLVRPWARGSGAAASQPDSLRAAVYDAAQNDGWRAGHRGVLALDLLAGPPGGGLDPAYAGGRAKLAIATTLFLGQVTPDAPASALDAQLASPLADALVTETLALLRQSDASATATTHMLAGLARSLTAWRARGAHTAASAPLKRLHDALTTRVLQALDQLPHSPQELTAEVRASIGSFISALTFAFRLAPLVEAARGERAEWFDTAVDGLAQRVFGLPPAGFAEVAYWPADRVRFLASLLAELDLPLRTCLGGMSTADQRARLFRAIHLPLVRVHGFLKTLREASNGGVWPHLAWVRAEIGAARLEALFDALGTRRWLDADDAVVELSRERLDAVLRASVWRTNPARLWSGRTGANFHAGVLAQLLEEPVPQDADLELAALAEALVNRLETTPALMAPQFPATAPGDKDVPETPWRLAPLALNLVTAAEWKDHPFIGTDGRTLAWRDSVTTGSGSQPFGFHLTSTVARRTVDGRRRARLVRQLDIALEPASPDERADRLALLARAVALLPNAPDNLAGATADLEAYRAQKAWVYQRLAAAMSASGGVPLARRGELARGAMLLDASIRSGAPLSPPLEQIFSAYILAASDAEAARMLVEDLRAERAELVTQAVDPSRDVNAWRRAAIDAGLAAFGKPVACGPDVSLRYRGFKSRLAALRPGRVLVVLRMRAHLRELLAHAATSEDLARCGALLELIDQTCFYGRPDFDVEQVGLLARPLPRGGDEGQWRPGLVVLAWCDGPLKERIAREAARARQRGAAGAALATCVEGKLRALNEAVFFTVRGIVDGAAGDAAAAFADFRPHQLKHALVDYRVLAEQIFEEEASAESLARDCFDGARMNLELAAARAVPGDAALQERLFGTGRTISVDALVRFAAVCAGSAALPAPLVEGASVFLKRPFADLLAGAGTAVGAFGALAACAEACARPDAPLAYRAWFEERLLVPAKAATDGSVLSAEVERAMAAPFFRGADLAQRADMARLLDRWRAWLTPGGSNGASSTSRAPGTTSTTGTPGGGDASARGGAPAGTLAHAMTHDFGRVLDHLLRGLMAPLGAARLWAPAARLADETGSRDGPPQEFFALVAWWLTLARPEDPAPVKALFDGADESTTPGAAPGDAGGGGGIRSLRAVYRARCDTQIRHLAKGLDVRAAGLATPPAGGMTAWAQAAWEQGPDARAEWRALLAAPRQYSAWATQARLPATFGVPDSQREHAVAGKRWEGLRALLVPESAAGAPRLGWDEPAGDAPQFTSAGGWALEWLLALRWQSAPPADAHVVDPGWARRETGAGALAGWLAATAAPLALYHGDYVYRPLAPPVAPPELAFRANVALTRLCTRTAPASSVPRLTSESDTASHDFTAAVRAKDDLAAALLALISASHGSDPVALDWFDAGARWFPYLTAWQSAPHPAGGVTAVEPRPADSRLAPQALGQDLPSGVAARLRAAVLFAPVARMTADGSCTPQVAGNSTFMEISNPAPARPPSAAPSPKTTSPRASSAAATPRVRASATTVPRERTPLAPSVARRRAMRAEDISLAPAGAWRAICEWVAQETSRALAGTPGGTPAVEHRANGWCLAFGAEELEQALAARSPRGVRVPARLRVRLVGVDAHAGVTVAIEVDGRELARRSFGVRGPWPPWFAVQTGLAFSRALLFCLLCAGLLVWRAVTRVRPARDAWDRVAFAVSACGLAGAWIAWPTPQPRATGEIGGLVEMWIPADEAVPERLRALGPLAGAHLYRALCRETGDELAIQGLNNIDPTTFERWRATAGQLTIPWPLVPARLGTHASAGPVDAGSLSEMHLRLNTYAFERVSAFEGRVDAAGLAAFRRATLSTEFGGEPDLAPAYFDADRGAALTVVLSDGEHGALAAVPEQAARRRARSGGTSAMAGLDPSAAAAALPRAPLVTFAAESPSRDADPTRGLTLDARLAWLTEHSSATLVLTPGSALVEAATLLSVAETDSAADRTAVLPQDMERAREAWWAGVSDAQLADAARRFAERAVLEFRRDRARTSRTVLEVEPHAGRFWLVLIAALLTALAPAWLARVGLTRPADAAAALAQALAGPAALALFLPAFALNAPARTFGLPLEESLRIALWTTVWALTAGTLIGVFFSLAARRSAFTSQVLHPKATWPTRRRVTLAALVARACGAFGLVVGLAALLSAPVGSPGGFWPEELGNSLVLALSLWLAGTTLLWTLPSRVDAGTLPPATR